MTAYPRHRAANSERMGISIVADHLADQAALADPFPASVCYAHFIRRDLAAAIEAGCCTVTMPHPLFASQPGVPVVDVTRMDDHVGYLLTTADGSQWTRYSKGSLAVTWHTLAATWAQLSPSMQLALRFQSGHALPGQRKPRWNTLRALQKRGLIERGRVDGPLTPLAIALVRQEVAHD